MPNANQKIFKLPYKIFKYYSMKISFSMKVSYLKTYQYTVLIIFILIVQATSFSLFLNMQRKTYVFQQLKCLLDPFF